LLRRISPAPVNFEAISQKYSKGILEMVSPFVKKAVFPLFNSIGFSRKEKKKKKKKD
jgi:hypothetical protein